MVKTCNSHEKLKTRKKIIVYFICPKMLFNSCFQNHYQKVFSLYSKWYYLFLPIQGYAVFSIIFSTLLFCELCFFGFVLKHEMLVHDPKILFIIIPKGFAFTSWSKLGFRYHDLTIGRRLTLVKLAIYFYLHFQYNAWFVSKTGYDFMLLCFVWLSNFSIKHSNFSKFFGKIFQTFQSGIKDSEFSKFQQPLRVRMFFPQVFLVIFTYFWFYKAFATLSVEKPA